jgi:predicted nucleic acid-binding protein
VTDTVDAESGADFLDANPVLRYLLGDDTEHLERSRALIESERHFRISIVTLAEIAYVLTRVAGISRADSVDALAELLNRENIQTHEVETDVAIRALRLCRQSGQVNFGDAMLWAVVRSVEGAGVWTFDEHFPSSELEVRRP